MPPATPHLTRDIRRDITPAMQRKGAVQERFVHPVTKREAVIRLDRRAFVFFATIETAAGVDETFESKDGREVREWLREQLSRTTNECVIEWVPVVQINDDSDGGTRRRNYREEDYVAGEKMELTVLRYYIGLTPNQQAWHRLRWEQWHQDSPTRVEPGLAFAQSKRWRDGPKMPVGHQSHRDRTFTLPFFDDGWNGGTCTYLPYTEELWDGLTALLAGLAQARATLRALIGTKQGIARLQHVGAAASTLLLEPPPAAAKRSKVTR